MKISFGYKIINAKLGCRYNYSQYIYIYIYISRRKKSNNNIDNIEALYDYKGKCYGWYSTLNFIKNSFWTIFLEMTSLLDSYFYPKNLKLPEQIKSIFLNSISSLQMCHRYLLKRKENLMQISLLLRYKFSL